MKPLPLPLNGQPRRTPCTAWTVRLAMIVLVGVLLTGCEFVDQLKNPESFAARERLETILISMEKGTHMAEQEVICLFYKSSRKLCDMRDLEYGTRDFKEWLNQKRVFKGIDSYEIVDFWEDPDEKNIVYYFRLRINDKNAYITVEHEGPIQWAKKKEKPVA